MIAVQRLHKHSRTLASIVVLLSIAATAFGQQMRFVPIRSAPLGSPAGTIGGPVTPVFNDTLGCWELALPGGGFEVDLALHAYGWSNASGNPTLGAILGTVDPAGYSNGMGGDLAPKGWPDNPSWGAYQPKFSCSGNGDPCTIPFDTTCGGGVNGTCEHSPDWVMPPCANSIEAYATPNLNYAWGEAAQADCNPNFGDVKTLGGLILNVPPDAAGTYVIAFNPNPGESFMLSGQGTPIPGLTLTPACITVSRPTKNRYLTFLPTESGPVAYKLDMVSSLFHPTATVSGWIGAPDANGIASLEPDPVTRTWVEPVVHVTGCEITPVAEFELRASTDDGLTFLPPTSLHTTTQPGGSKFWGDIVGFFDGNFWTSAQGVVNANDILAVIRTWQQANGAPALPRSDVEPQEPNRVVNANDMLFVIFAFKGEYYPFGCPDDPCQNIMANPCP